MRSMLPMIRRLIDCCRFAWLALGLLIAELASPSIAWAQQQPEPPPTHNVTVPYLLVILCLSLGLIMLCRSANRTKDVKLEDLDD